MNASNLLENPPAEEDTHAIHRTKRIKLAASTSVFSKIVTMSVNVFAMPLAMHALGVAKFGVYAMLGATLSWITMAQIGIGPGLTLGIAKSNAEGDLNAQKRYFSSAIITIGTIATSLACVLLICIWSLPTSTFFGHRIDTGAIPELRLDMSCFVVFVSTKMILSVFDASQAGYQEQFICNLWMALGNSLSLVALLILSHMRPMILSIIIAVNAMPLIADSCNGTRLITLAHPQLRPSFRFYDWKLAKSLLGNGIAFSAVTASSYLMYACGTLLVGRIHGSKSAALFAVLQQANTMALGLVLMFSSPLWPALNDAKARRDRKWAMSASRRIVLYGMTYASVVGGTVALLGHEIFKIWYHSRINVTEPIQLFWGLYFILAVWEFVQYNILIGMNKLKEASVVMVLRSLLMLAIAPTLITKFGNGGLYASMCIAQLALSAWIFPILTKRSLSAESFGA